MYPFHGKTVFHTSIIHYSSVDAAEVPNSCFVCMSSISENAFGIYDKKGKTILEEHAERLNISLKQSENVQVNVCSTKQNR